MAVLNSRARLVRWNGRDLTLAQIAHESGFKLKTLEDRYKAGKRCDQLTEPLRCASPVSEKSTLHVEHHHENGDGL